MSRAGRPLDPWQRSGIEICLGVRHDGKWACFEYCDWVSRQNGKGGILEARALTGFLLLGERLIMWSAHEYKTAIEAFRRVKMLISRLGRKITDTLYEIDDIPIKVINTNGEEGFERLDADQRIRFIARSKGSGRGFDGEVNIIDEAFALTLAQQEALMPTMSAQYNPQIIYMSSPPLTGDTGDVMFALRKRGDPTAPRGDDDPPWAQDDSLGYRDWGLGGDLDHLDGIDPDDEALWRATNPSLGIRITAETVRRERRAMSLKGFCRERLGIWPFRPADDLGWAVIGEEAWNAALDLDSAPVDPVAFAIDANPERTWCSIGVAGKRDDGLYHAEVFDRRPGTGWVRERVKTLVDKWRPCAVVIDPASPAASLIPELEEAGVDIVRTTAREMAQACGKLWDGIAGEDESARNIRVRPVGEHGIALTAAVKAAVKRDLGDAWAWDRDGTETDLSPLVAVTLALYGYATHAHLAGVPNLW